MHWGPENGPGCKLRDASSSPDGPDAVPDFHHLLLEGEQVVGLHSYDFASLQFSAGRKDK